jgi:selenide,water dikinase
LLHGVEDLLDAGFVPGGTQRNAEQAAAFLTGDLDERDRLLLSDAQTSGGLLLGVARHAAEELVTSLRGAGYPHATVIGTVTPGDGRITLV